jgi:Mechanosensitive ion channel
MRWFFVLLPLLFLSFFPVFGQSASDQLSASISLFPSYEKSVTSSDTLKKLKQQESELVSLIKLESARVFSEDESDFEQKRDDFLKQKNAELAEVNLQLERLQKLRSHQIWTTLQQVSWYVLVFIFLYLLRVISRSFLARFGRSFSEWHQEVLFLIHRWVFHILFFGALLMIFSVEFVSFLPFIAILTTAVGFSLREVISSFIGWFVIEADSGYKVGDLIELDTMTGRVKHITPLLTTIEEYGVQWFTGKIISFPNKTIFEKSIKNWSHGSDFLMISNDFLLSYESDIVVAKELLMEVVWYNALPQYYKSRKEINLFKFIYNFTDEDLKPQIHVLTDNKWITLRVRNLVHMKDRFSEQSRIVETFISRVQKEKKVAMAKV